MDYSRTALRLIKSILRIIFPPLCFHCKKSHDKLGAPLCEACITFLEWVSPSTEILVTFEGMGPAESLLQNLKAGRAPHLASLLAAYMAIQYAQSQLPMPDLVVHVPSARWRKWQTGGECAGSLAKELSKLMEVPCAALLKRKGQLLRQDLLTREERTYLSSEEFQWKNWQNLSGKTVLLVDDTVTTGTTLACCAERLWEASPAKIIKMGCLDRGYLQG